MAVYLGSNKVAAHGGLPSGGGGGGSVEAKDVNFYDYDGTIVASYSKNDFLALTQMPSNPNHSGDDIPLTSQGWNWSLTNAKTYVTNYGKLEIGQMYVPTDGKTHIVIEIPEKVPTAQLTYYVRYTQTVNNGVTVDWGDGSTPETFTGTTATDRSHTYAAPGTYDITLNVTSGSVSFAGAVSGSTVTSAIYGPGSNQYNAGRIKQVRLGNGVTSIGDHTFRNCYALTSITISTSVTTIGTYAFYQCYALSSVTIPSTVTSIGDNTFGYCYALSSVTIPSTVTSISTYIFRYCYSLTSVTVPASVTTIGSGAYYFCSELASITIPASVTTIDTYAFSNCFMLSSITIPSTVTAINASAFVSCYSVSHIRLLPTTPPTLANTNAFNNIPASVLFIVPDNSVTTYKGASNWSTYASRIIGESNWNPA